MVAGVPMTAMCLALDRRRADSMVGSITPTTGTADSAAMDGRQVAEIVLHATTSALTFCVKRRSAISQAKRAMVAGLRVP